VAEHPALGWSGGERAKSAAILKKFRADFDGLRMKRTGQAEPTDEQVRDFYRARAALLEDTMQKLKKDLGGQAWSDVLGVTGKHLSEGKP
jgi:hypothetical protein